MLGVASPRETDFAPAPGGAKKCDVIETGPAEVAALVEATRMLIEHLNGGKGPDWPAKGFGSTPAWFDGPSPMREAEVLYAGGSIGIGRNHGGWNADGNTSLTRFNAKDWPGRPL